MSNSTPSTIEQQENPFARPQLPGHVAAGTVSIESERAIAEAQGKLVVAKRFPRDEASSFAKAMVACSRISLAQAAIYAYPKGGKTVSGPSIRLAEELARCWGNIEYGIRELSRKPGESEMQAYCHDLENNVYSVQNFTVKHIRDTQGGGKALMDERDIYEITANMGGRRLRSRIMAVLPPDYIDAAVEACRKTIAGGNGEAVEDRIKRMVAAFAKLGVKADLIAKRLGHVLDETTPDELAELTGIHNGIRDGASTVADWFGDSPKQAPSADGKPGRLSAIIEANRKPKEEAPEEQQAAE